MKTSTGGVYFLQALQSVLCGCVVDKSNVDKITQKSSSTSMELGSVPIVFRRRSQRAQELFSIINKQVVAESPDKMISYSNKYE